MTKAERLTLIRENAQKSKAQFAALLNISPSLMTMYENGQREISNRTAADICNRFGVRREWFELGDGEPYEGTAESIMHLLRAEYNLDNLDCQIIEMYLSLTQQERAAFKDLLKKYVKKIGDAD